MEKLWTKPEKLKTHEKSLEDLRREKEMYEEEAERYQRMLDAAMESASPEIFMDLSSNPVLGEAEQNKAEQLENLRETRRRLIEMEGKEKIVLEPTDNDWLRNYKSQPDKLLKEPNQNTSEETLNINSSLYSRESDSEIYRLIKEADEVLKEAESINIEESKRR